MESAIGELRLGADTLEDVFVRTVGGERAIEKLDWL
jgi:hypothetical protein